MRDKNFLFFGFGFCAEFLAPLLHNDGWHIAATYRAGRDGGTGDKPSLLKKQGITPLAFDNLSADNLAHITHGLVSIPPDENGDVVLKKFAPMLEGSALKWLGYLSTTAVYGDHAGAWIDEDTPIGKLSARGRRRTQAEADWLDFGAQYGVGVNLFRLAGIYGPNRNQLRAVKNGTARRIIKSGQVFSRIHVRDIAAILNAAIKASSHKGGYKAGAGRAYSVCDDEPAPPQDVVAFAAHLLGVPAPPEIAFEKAELSAMARGFYDENKRIKNTRIKTELGVALAYPTYREGLRALFADKMF